MVDRTEANAKFADLVYLVLLLTVTSADDALPIIFGELGIIIDIKGRPLKQNFFKIKVEDDILTCIRCRPSLPSSGGMRRSLE